MKENNPIEFFSDNKIIEKNSKEDNTGTLLVLIAIIIITALIFLIITSTKAYACQLTPVQSDIINNMSTQMNVSNATFHSIFTMLCGNITSTENKTSSLNASINSNMALIWNTTAGNMTEMTAKVSNATSSFYANYSQILSVANTNAIITASQIRNNFSIDLQRYEDTVDDRLKNFKRDYLTSEWVNSSLQNITSDTERRLYSFEMQNSQKFSTSRQYWMWSFFAMSGLLIGFAYIIRYKPEYASFVTGIKHKRHSAFEITTPSELKSKIEKVRELKLKVVKISIDKELKQILMNKIDAEEIKSEKDLQEETEILRGLHGRKK